MQRIGAIDAIRSAVHQGRPTCTDIVPGSPLRHFLYKSRGNVQFTMPSYAPYFAADLEKRRYVKLHSLFQKATLITASFLLLSNLSIVSLAFFLATKVHVVVEIAGLILPCPMQSSLFLLQHQTSLHFECFLLIRGGRCVCVCANVITD